jgi:hypothetical protein
MTTKHTPGPWKVRKSFRGKNLIVEHLAGTPGNHWVQEVCNVPGQDDESAATAALIAAAPDLLEAARAMLEASKRPARMIAHDDMEGLRQADAENRALNALADAVSKAEGK